MRVSLLKPLLAAAAFCVAPLSLSAQTIPGLPPGVRPSPDQAQELLRTRPDLVQQLQQRLGTSGLTPEQVRARLRAEGYPESLLDAYLPGGSGAAPTDASNTASVLDAVQALGVADSTDVALLRDQAFGSRSAVADTIELVDPRTGRPVPRVDSLRINDSTYVVPGDSLLDLRRGRVVRVAPPADSMRIFGRDLFRNRTSQFDANLAGPVDANYRLGPGDRLVLIITGEVERAATLDVTREGFVVIPQVGQVNVANLTLGQLEDVLYSRLSRVYSGISRSPNARTRFSISVARLRSNQVFVVGDVERPGSYRISSAGTALSALYAAGGPTLTGSLRRIEVRRGDRVVSTLDVYDYLLRGDASSDVRLETGDRVFVAPQQGRVRVAGEVLRPAIYELERGETLADVVRNAGGFTATANQQRLQIERVLPAAERATGGRDRVVVDVTAGTAGGAVPALPLQAGDVIRVFGISERVRNRVTVLGNVWSPGAQGVRDGMRVSDALRGAGGLKPDTYLGQVLVTRLRPDSTRIQLRATLRDTTGAVVNDFALQEDDELQVFSVTEFRPTRYVAITGAVRRGGRFRYREGMTVRDLVLLAGGMEESALLNEAEIARLPEDRRNGVTARTFRVPLDSSYLFERAPDGRYIGPPGMPAASGPTPDIALAPYDNLLILRQPDFALQRSVFIGGEVRFPGRYALRTKTESLSDLIGRAGGMTTESYAAGVEFYRARNRLGRVGIDLPAALKDPKHRDNLVLLDGDSVLIPAFNPIVTVRGSVNQESAVAFVPNQDLNWYVRAAGGLAREADASRAYVVQPNGKLESIQRRRFFPDAIPTPRAGSRVYVPARDPNQPRRDLTQLVGVFAQIAATLSALALVYVTLKNDE